MMDEFEQKAFDLLDEAQAQLWLIGADRFAKVVQNIRDQFKTERDGDSK